MNNDPMLDFVKAKLEENEGISSDALSHLLSVAETQRLLPSLNTKHQALSTILLAASLAVAACGWLFYANAANARRENNLTNVIDLLRAADGEDASEASSLSENLLAWQDAPSHLSDVE